MKTLHSIEKLTNAFSKLPGVGVKSAERMAYAVLSMEDDDVNDMVESIVKVKSSVHNCPTCGTFTEGEMCEICSDSERNHKVICVVAEPKDVIALENMNSFDGVYHVLGGTINIAKGRGPDSLTINQLLDRIKKDEVNEVILGLDSRIEGETTALFIARLLQGSGVTVTRLAYGIPVGASLDYADSLTLSKAFEGRKKV